MVELVIEIEEGWEAGSVQTVTGAQGVTVQFTVPPGVAAGDTIAVRHTPPETPAGRLTLPTHAPSLFPHTDGRARRGSSTQSALTASPAVGPSDARPTASARSPLNPRQPRVDTAALTGLRGMAAMQVALGHMTAGSNMRLDLLGGAAMPFFYLLSGFVMTLGYGQTQYTSSSCCSNASPLASGGQPQQMNKGKFWRNRFARLFPVYIATNAPMLPVVLAGGGVGIGGGGMGSVGSVVNGLLTLLGANSWFLPIVDVGMPANGVCWTITTMSFFYWTFPWLLPRMQRMTASARNAWIIWSYWIQLATYFGMYIIYTSIPVLQFRSSEHGGESIFVVNNSPAMGYWVARAWPGTRIFVFAMGCLAALNRLEVHTAQTLATEQPTPQRQRPTEAQTAKQKQTWTEQNGDEEKNASTTSMQLMPVHGDGAEKGAVVIAEACSCWRGLCCCVCGCMGASHGPSSHGDSVEVWAWRTDRLTFLYLGSIFAIIMIERFAFAIMGRIVLEGLCPMLELSMIVSLTYDRRRSWTARFCNTRPIRLLGDISMSFYMTHMLAYMFFTAVVPGVTDDIDWPMPVAGSGSNGEDLPFDPNNVCPQIDFSLCMADMNVTVPEGWGSYENYCNACIQAWLFGGMPLLRGIFVPGAMATALVVGWFLMRWVEIPGQILLRRDSSWEWTRLRRCCSWLPAWFPSCCAWECCCCIYFCCCGCCCGCCKRLRKNANDASHQESLLG